MTTSSPGLCVTVGGSTAAGLAAARDAVAPAADLVELRLDAMDRPDVHAALAGRRRPVVVTCRPSWEGGGFAGSEEERLALLRQAWTLGAEHVDVEWRAPGAARLLEETGGRRIVLSMHDFEGVPADLDAIVAAMASTTAAVLKIAVTARGLADSRPIFALRQRLAGRPFVGIAMGTAGIPTRILAARVGCCWTYAGASWAPGQVPAARLIEEFGFRRARPDSAVYGVTGAPVGGSLSPAMHNAAFAAEGLDAVYVPLEALDAGDFLTFADAIGLAGASVTHPYKVALAAHARADAMVERVGALNTLKRDAGGWVATNTDVGGFIDPLLERTAVNGRRAAILGAGGAARAVALALQDHGARVTLHARRRDQAEAVARDVGAAVADPLPAPDSWDLLVNATSVGMPPQVEDTPLPIDCLRPGGFVYDLVSVPTRTRLMRDAEAAGCATLGGLAMLVGQARRQIEWWTGRHVEAAVMRAAAERALRLRDEGAATGDSRPRPSRASAPPAPGAEARP